MQKGSTRNYYVSLQNAIVEPSEFVYGYVIIIVS